MQLRCELSIAPILTATQPAELTFSLSNAGTQPVRVLNWQTPFEGVRAPMFTVKRDGVALDYRGMMVKRGAPGAESYLGLKSGERKRASVDLAEGWDVAAPGNYTVEYSSQLFDVATGTAGAPRSLDRLTPLTLSCAPVAFKRER